MLDVSACITVIISRTNRLTMRLSDALLISVLNAARNSLPAFPALANSALFSRVLT
jgi:hypothetical protein